MGRGGWLVWLPFVLGHDHSSTLSTPRWDCIFPVYEKLTYYSLDHLGWRWDIRSTNTQLIIWGSNLSPETWWPDILPTRPPECWYKKKRTTLWQIYIFQVVYSYLYFLLMWKLYIYWRLVVNFNMQSFVCAFRFYANRTRLRYSPRAHMGKMFLYDE